MTTVAVKALRKVRKIMARFGEDGQIIRKTVTTDPSNPTKVITVETTYTARMYFDSPRTSYVADGLVAQRAAQLYVDLLSIKDDLGDPVNSEDSVTFVTDQDDIAVRADGTRLTLLANTDINANGVPCFGQHEVSR